MTPSFRNQLIFILSVIFLFGVFFLATFISNYVYVPMVERLGGSVKLIADEDGSHYSLATWGYIGFWCTITVVNSVVFSWLLWRLLRIPILCPNCRYKMRALEKGARLTYLCKKCGYREHFESTSGDGGA